MHQGNCLGRVQPPALLKKESHAVSEEYSRDIDAAIASVTKNYAGYADKRARFGAAVIDAAANRARERAKTAQTHEDCLGILNDYVKVFRDGHVSALYYGENKSIRNAAFLFTLKASSKKKPEIVPPSNDPTARLIGDDAILITIPAFDVSYKADIDALVKKYDAEIKRRHLLIIDLRGNGGGSDDSYDALRPYLYTQPILNVGVDILATKESADAWEAIIAWVPATETETISGLKEKIKRMREAPEGTFIKSNDDSADTFPEVLPNPARVAVIIDGKCASTTEQFLLEARQSKKVTLFGQSSEGVLDYANVRVFPLPSGKRMLGLATTRSRRLPKDPVDNIGIKPNIRIEHLTQRGDKNDKAVEMILKHYTQQEHHP